MSAKAQASFLITVSGPNYGLGTNGRVTRWGVRVSLGDTPDVAADNAPVVVGQGVATRRVTPATEPGAFGAGPDGHWMVVSPLSFKNRLSSV